MTAKASDEDSPLATGAVLSPLSIAFILSTNCWCNRFSFRVHVKIHAWNLPTLSPAVTPCRLNLLLFFLAWWLEMQSWRTHFRPARWKAAGCSCVIWLGTARLIVLMFFTRVCFRTRSGPGPGVSVRPRYQNRTTTDRKQSRAENTTLDDLFIRNNSFRAVCIAALAWHWTTL